MELIDTHCHLNFKNFKEDADDIIKQTLNGGIGLINIGAQYSTSRRAIDYAKKYEEGVWAVVGLHPIHIGSEQRTINNNHGAENSEQCEKEKFDYEKYLELAKNDKVVAIGEVGLDYHHFHGIDKREVAGTIELQKKVFKEFVRMSNEIQKPLAIHCWNADKKDKELVNGAVAYEDVLEILDGLRVDNQMLSKGVIHSFIGNYKMANKFIERGFKIGLNGIITYSESYDRLIREVGLENIILETDAPYLTPNPLKRYSRNEPLNIKLVAQKVADVLGIDIKKVAKITTKNAKETFNI